MLSEGEFRAVVVEDEEVIEDLDDSEVASLTKLMNSRNNNDNEDVEKLQEFVPSIYVDWRNKADTSNIKLIVQDYDTTAEETDADLPDLDTFDTWGWEDEPEHPASTHPPPQV